MARRGRLDITVNQFDRCILVACVVLEQSAIDSFVCAGDFHAWLGALLSYLLQD